MILLSKDSWEIKNTEKKGRGIFAKKHIAAGTVVADYIGIVLRLATSEITDQDNKLYLMYYNDQAAIYPNDLQIPGAHCFNHSCMPNCWMYTYQGHTLFFALRHIFPKEELTISYLLSPKDAYCNPCQHVCFCENIICSHSMHLSENKYHVWKTFNTRIAKKTKRKRVAYGKLLQILSDYPKVIQDNPVYTLYGNPKITSKNYYVSNMPSSLRLRHLLRETGRTIQLPRLNIKILGVDGENIISEKIGKNNEEL